MIIDQAQNFPGETPVLSGGIPITVDWQQYRPYNPPPIDSIYTIPNQNAVYEDTATPGQVEVRRLNSSIVPMHAEYRPDVVGDGMCCGMSITPQLHVIHLVQREPAWIPAAVLAADGPGVAARAGVWCDIRVCGWQSTRLRTAERFCRGFIEQ